MLRYVTLGHVTIIASSELCDASDDEDVCPPVSLPHIRVPASAPPVRSAHILCLWCEGEKLIQQINNELGIVHFFRAFYFFLLHLKLSGTKLQKWKQLTLIFEPAS